MSDICSSESPVIPPVIEGWEYRYIGNDPRLSEQVELYEQLGFKVKLEPLKPEMCGGCVECFKDSTIKYAILYVQKPVDTEVNKKDDDLF